MPLREVVDEATPAGVAAAVEAVAVERQRSFAALSFDAAVAVSDPVVRHILDRMAQAFRGLFGPLFDESRVVVTARVDRRSAYVQLQGPHVDWARTREFREDEWAPGRGPHGEGGLRALERCHSIDCVLGGPATEFFLGEQEVAVLLVRPPEDPDIWMVDAMEFPQRGRPQPSLTGILLYRPPFTVHQFPAVSSWAGDNELRLFVSGDFWAPAR